MLDQRDQRIQHLGGIDSAAVARQKRQTVRLEKKNNQAAVAATKARIVTETQHETIEISSSSDAEAEEEYLLPTRNKPKEIQLTINTKKFVKQLSQASLARGLSHRDQTVLCATVVKAGGGNVNDLTLSPASTHRHNVAARKEKALEVRKSFLSKGYKFLSAPWDGKLIK